MINIQSINFSKGDGLIPCIAQDHTTHVVLMLGYMNQEALEKSISEKRLTFYSRSRQRLWTKGETSGNFLKVVDFLVDCDNDTLLAKVLPMGPACHTGADTCFNEKNDTDGLAFLESIIQNRKRYPKEGSYTNQLFNSGINKIAQKLGEEAIELIIEAKDNNNHLFVGEAADLVYHFLVLLAAKDHSMEDVLKTLRQRHR
jgi:phosphoribosyl-ATP pyrophosphohydrolase/phosphoribosyl-AMP cyclohydrolase